jgi:hypothetical protein
MIELTKWTDDRPALPGLYWYRKSGIEQAGRLISIETSQLNGQRLVAFTPDNADRRWCYLDDMPGQWAPYISPAINDDECLILLMGIAGLYMQQLQVIKTSNSLLNEMIEVGATNVSGLTYSQIQDTITGAGSAVQQYGELARKILLVSDQKVDVHTGMDAFMQQMFNKTYKRIIPVDVESKSENN